MNNKNFLAFNIVNELFNIYDDVKQDIVND